MITLELILAIATYNFVMYATPGPNNSILTTSGIKFGFYRSVPNILGIPTGHGLQLVLVCLGLGSLFTTFPLLLDILRYIGATYISINDSEYALSLDGEKTFINYTKNITIKLK